MGAPFAAAFVGVVFFLSCHGADEKQAGRQDLQEIEYVLERAWYASTTELEDIGGIRVGWVASHEVAEHGSPVVGEFRVEEVGEVGWQDESVFLL